MTLTIHDIIPYYMFDATNRISLVPMEMPSLVEFPLDTALVLNEGGNESVYMIQITSWSFYPEEKSLTLEIIPEEFYDGDGLKNICRGYSRLCLQDGWKRMIIQASIAGWHLYQKMAIVSQIVTSNIDQVPTDVTGFFIVEGYVD